MRFKLLSFFLLVTTVLFAQDRFSLPWGKDADLSHTVSQEIKEKPKSSPLIYLATKAIRFHQEVLSPVDGPRSHFKPSSSQYMLLALQKHGFLKGVCMGCDRLLRENNDAWVYQQIDVNGTLYKFDPVP